MTSQPRRIASRISSLPFGKLRIPSWGKAMSRRSTMSRISSRSSSSARRATSPGSHTSTCERISPVPWATSQRIAWRARRLTSSWVSEGLRSAQVWIPSMSVPDSLWRGSPTVRTASRWTCGSTRGGERNRPSPSSTVSPVPGRNSPIGRIAAIRSPATRRSTGTGRWPPVGWIRTSWTNRPIRSYAIVDRRHGRSDGVWGSRIGRVKSARPGLGTTPRATLKVDESVSGPALPHRVTVVGGGFGGLYAARSLGHRSGSPADAGRSAQLPPLPAAALPGRHRRPVARRDRPAAALGPAPPAQRDGDPRRGRRAGSRAARGPARRRRADRLRHADRRDRRPSLATSITPSGRRWRPASRPSRTRPRSGGAS